MAAGIKWENIKILNSPLTNSIYLGKLDKAGKFIIDKSTDRTAEIKTAMITHADMDTEKDGAGVAYGCEAGTLTWLRAGNKSRADYMNLAKEQGEVLQKLQQELEECSKTGEMLTLSQVDAMLMAIQKVVQDVSKKE